MPVPWSYTSTIIPAVEHRAITIQQLRDLEVFIQRLCKVGLLKSGDAQNVQWFQVNMYAIASLIIKPVISFVEKKRGSQRKLSWVEFVANEPQTPKLLFSHSWAGRFRDFMAIVRLVARDNELSTSVPVWICTFANCQFGEDFGTGLRESPFYKAIQTAKDGTLLVVDRDTSSLQRIWCGLELHLTMLMQKRLQVYTSVGQVGVSVKSGRLVEAIEDWDVRRMEASEDSDRRQILNFLARGETHEKDGLLVDADGNLDLVDGWQKQLVDKEVTTDAPRREDNRQEYVHEANLFQTHAQKYDQLNCAVREKVMVAANVGSSDGCKPGCTIDRLEDRGVSLAEMRSFAKQVTSWCKEADNVFSYASITIAEVVDYFIKPYLASGGTYASCAEKWSFHPRIPRIVVDEVWGSSFQDCMTSMEWFTEAKGLLDDTVVYFTPLCLRQLACEDDHANWDRSINSLLSNCDAWLTILEDKEESIVRSNKVQQFQLCFLKGKDIYLGCTEGVLACTKPFPDSSWIFGGFSLSIARILVEARWEEARSVNKNLQKRVKDSVQASRGGFGSFKARVARAAVGPILRQTAAIGSGAEIMKLIGPPVLVNSSALKGGLGETAVHCAAAAGNLEALQALLDRKADANAEDHIRETPLHYAAMAGMVGSVQLLLKYGAEPRAESAFAEEPLFVAEQNPAEFLSKDTSHTCSVFRAWDVVSPMRGIH